MAKRTITVTIADSFEELSADELGLLISQSKELAKIGKGAETYAMSLLNKGKPVTGWAKGKGTRSRVWKSEEEAKTVMAACGINDFYVQNLLTVPAAEEKVPEDMKDKLESAWEWKDGSPKLVPATKSVLDAQPTPDYGF